MFLSDQFPRFFSEGEKHRTDPRVVDEIREQCACDNSLALATGRGVRQKRREHSRRAIRVSLTIVPVLKTFEVRCTDVS